METKAALRAPAFAAAMSESVRSALARLATMLVALGAFVFGALLPDLRGADSFGPAWLAISAFVSVLVLPVLAFGSGVGAVHRLLDRRSASPLARRLEVGLVAAAATSLLLYASPWGIAAVRWFMTALD